MTSSLVKLLLFISLIFNASEAINDLQYKLIYGEKGIADFVAYSRKLGIEVECVNPKMVALTFDDGPRETTESILDYLKKRKIPATFFLIGSAVNSFDSTKNLLRRMKREGHTIATHSSTHMDMSWMTEADILLNFQDPAEAVENAIGYRPCLMRPPYGLYSQAVIDVAKTHGFKVVNWNVDSNDWRFSYQDRPHSVYSQIESQEGPMHSSKIILLHDQHFQKETLDLLVKFYQKKGYKFVNMQQCLGKSAYF